MSYIVTAKRGVTAMTSSIVTPVQAIEWIRRRRVVGADCAAAWNKDPLSGVIGAEEGPLIPMV